MLLGENLCAEESGRRVRVRPGSRRRILDGSETSCGWFCRRCASKKHAELRRREQLAMVIVRNISR